MNVSHPVTQFNSGQPLRDHRPDDLVHPFLSNVNFSLHAHKICGIVDAINGANKQGSINTDKEFLQSNQLNKLIESSPATSPAAGNASALCTCLEFIGDNGYCAVHGEGHK